RIKERANYEKNLSYYLLKDSRKRAKRKGLEHTLTKVDIEDLLNKTKVCPILHIPLKVNKKKAGFDSPTLDRIDNSKGYTKNNVAIISYKANSLKRDLSLEQAKRLVQYMKRVLE